MPHCEQQIASSARSNARGTRRRNAGGFTLVELLVVIGIIALLISILMPALSRSRKVAQRMNCMSAMRQLGIALQAYAAENKGHTPVQVSDAVADWADPAVYDQRGGLAGRSVFSTLFPYIAAEKRLFVCPMAYEESWTGGGNPTTVSDTNYMTNAATVDKRLARFGGRASEVVFIQENRHRWNIAWLRPARFTAKPPHVYSMWCWDNPNPRPDGKRWGQE